MEKPIVDILLRIDTNTGKLELAVLGVQDLPVEQLADYLEAAAKEYRRIQVEALKKKVEALSKEEQNG